MDETYYYSKDICLLFGYESIGHLIRYEYVPKPEVIKKDRRLVRRWLKPEIDAILAERDESDKA